MYLKEIRISGFKSFADKINLTMNDDITCIVGPNGSGKSNIVDAVKWVLGEQSVKSLRGTNNMTDVIFAGSKSRSPLNLASVSLIFDNSDSYLKVGFSEISVTRKVYRSGENEYYINQEKCRLKDIFDLFLDSGMGKYAFNIISQGEVSKIISDSPYDRRVLFEEAAGVLKYKKRKEEALRKLDKTNENLLRVTDIISELEGQLEPLKEQSEKAKKYLETKDKLQNIEIALIATDLEKLNVSYQEGVKKAEEIQNKVILESTSSVNNDLKLEESKKQLIKFDEEINKLNEEYVALIKEEEKINGEKNIINERSKYASDDIKVHENITRLKEEQYILHNKFLSCQTDIDILKKKLNTITDKLNKFNSELNDCVKKRTGLENDLSFKKKDLVDTEYKIKSLTDYIYNNQSFNPSVNRILNHPKLKGIHSTISKIIEIDSKYAVALDIALGAAKDFLVVDDQNVAKNCIDYLKENKLGRVTFFPLNVIKSRNVDNNTLDIVSREKGFIDVLSNLTKYDSVYKAIVENQIGNVLVVDNLENANTISKKINERYRIVTLAGDIIHVGGSITGGIVKTNSIISEKYELENLKTKSNILKNKIDEINEELKSLLINEKNIQYEIINYEKEKLLVNEELSNKNSLINNTNEGYEKAKQELNQLTGLLEDNFKKEEDKIMERYYDVLNKKNEKSKNIKVLQDEKSRLNAALEQLEASFRYSNSKIRELEATLKDYEIANTKMSSKMDHLLETLSNDYQMTFEKARANYVLELDYDFACSEVTRMKNELKRIGIVNTGAIEEYERISTRYEFLNKQSEDLKEAMKTLLQIIDDLDQVMKQEFVKTFKEIEIEFKNVFQSLFGGGSASLRLTDKDDILNTGVDIVVTPPGKKVSTISLLSGGEKTLTAISLLFAILNIKKIPFCIFDEVEAALDEANVAKVGEYFSKYVGKTQLIIITHKKKTMEYANTLYGITMQESGVSKLVSVKLVDNN